MTPRSDELSTPKSNGCAIVRWSATPPKADVVGIRLIRHDY